MDLEPDGLQVCLLLTLLQPAVLSQTRSFISANLSFVICKMEIIVWIP